MRKILRTLLLIAAYGTLAHGASLTRSSPRHAYDKVGLGLGFSGVPGISGYADISRDNFVQAGLGFANHGSYGVTGDYAFAYPRVFRGAPTVTPFWGLGVLVLHDGRDYWSRYFAATEGENTYAGARIPLGFNFVIPRTPVQLEAELAPSLIMVPIAMGYLQGGVSLRILF
jgi:hypothetical protein